MTDTIEDYDSDPNIDSYLLDTGVVSCLIDEDNVHHKWMRDQVDKIVAGGDVYICGITIAQIEYGLRLADAIHHVDANNIRNALVGFETIPMGTELMRQYGIIRAGLFRRYAPRTPQGARHRGATRASQLMDDTNDLQLGIQENDIWVVAEASLHSLHLLTTGLGRGKERIVDEARRAVGWNLVHKLSLPQI